MKQSFKRMIWRMVVGSWVVIASSIGGIWAIHAHDEVAESSYIALAMVGTMWALSGLRDRKKSN